LKSKLNRQSTHENLNGEGLQNEGLNDEALVKILQAEDIEQLSLTQLSQLFQEEKGSVDFIPDGICQIDPRNGERIIYNSARARRPHDNRPVDSPKLAEKPCAVCQGKTTGVVDVADLSEGFTFINKNLFPILYPADTPQVAHISANPDENNLGPEGKPVYGFHFLQWTSSLHDRDWHNMPQSDRVVVMQRLATLEKKLLTDASNDQYLEDRDNPPGFVSIIKNYGHLVGGSLVHGHQQIGFSNVMPRRFHDNWQFEQQQGELFSAYLLRENPSNLLLRDYGPAVLVVPYFMRRPFDMMLLVKDTGKRYLHELTEAEITAVADGWHDAIRAILWVMPNIGRETAYNVVTHNGSGAGLYFEFLPYTQETGGFEQLGLSVCQGNPLDAAAQLRQFLEQ
jgi:galactose-1-phosphate uridylyltransferase